MQVSPLVFKLLKNVYFLKNVFYASAFKTLAEGREAGFFLFCFDLTFFYFFPHKKSVNCPAAST